MRVMSTSLNQRIQNSNSNKQQSAQTTFAAKQIKFNYGDFKWKNGNVQKHVDALHSLIRRVKQDKDLKAVMEKVPQDVEFNISSNTFGVGDIFNIDIVRPRNEYLSSTTMVRPIEDATNKANIKSIAREIKNTVEVQAGLKPGLEQRFSSPAAPTSWEDFLEIKKMWDNAFNPWEYKR